MNENEEFEFRLRAEQEARPANYYRRMSTTPHVDPMEGIGTGQRMLEGAGKMFTDLGRGAAQAVGFGPTRAEVDERRDLDVPLMATPAGFAGNIGAGAAATLPLAAIPGANTIPGAVVSGGLYGAAQPVGTGESRTLNTAVGGATGGAVKYGLDKAAPALAGALQARQTAAEPVNARAAQLAQVLREGQDLGLRVPPSQANPSTTNRIVESMGGKAATQQQASALNQDVIYAAGQRAAGLKPGQALTEEALNTARNAAAAPYRAVAQQSKEAAQALEMWRNANNEAKLYGIENARSGTVASYKAMQSARAEADMALDEIELLAGSAAKDALKAARVQIAKIHTVEDAMRGSNFNAQALAKALDKGVPLSGDLKTLARFAQDFPKAVAPPQVGGSVGVNQLMPWLGGGAGGSLGAMLGGPLGAGAGSVLGALATQAVPPAARSVVLSPMYQRLMTTPPQSGPSASQRLAAMLSSNPELQSMLPAMAGMTAAGR